MVQTFPQKGDILYLEDRKVFVTDIYEKFHLIKIRYIEKTNEFFIDVCALTSKDKSKSSISLGLLRRSQI